VAQVLGVRRHPSGHCRARYAAGGVNTLLALSVPAGTPLSLPPDVLAAQEQALRQPAGFPSHDALRPWIQQTAPLDVNSHTLDTIIRTRCPAKLKVPRPSHTKNPEAMAEFQATCLERLPRVIPPGNPHPVRVLSQDESRFGLLTAPRRRLTARGVQPVGPIPHVAEWFYVYGAVAPTTGGRFFRERPYRNAESCQLFIAAFAQAFPDSLNLLLPDHRGAHTAPRRTRPAPVRLVF